MLRLPRRLTKRCASPCPVLGHYVSGVDIAKSGFEKTVVQISPGFEKAMAEGPWNSIRRCVKCNKWHSVNRHPALGKDEPCPDCLAARPPAKSGFEYTREWKYPAWEDYWVSFHSDVRHHCYPDQARDQGRRWILKKVEKPKPSTEDWITAHELRIDETFRRLDANADRIKKLEQQH